MSHFSEEAHFLEVEGMGVVRPLLWGHFSFPLGPCPQASPMFQVPMKTEIMSGSSCFECLFFMSCSSWQKASRFWGSSRQ